jgi:hypothetical protein
MSRKIDISNWGDQPPHWVILLANEVESSNRTKTAERIGISRTAVSLLLANRYSSPSTAGMERRILAALDGIHCPAHNEMISTEQCRAYRDRPAPTHNPMAMRVWRVCQSCEHNPKRGQS